MINKQPVKMLCEIIILIMFTVCVSRLESGYEYLDSEQSIVKSYVAFLTKIPLDYKGVQDIEYSDREIVISERESKETRNITINIQN